MNEPTAGAAEVGTQAVNLSTAGAAPVGLFLGHRYRLSAKIGRGSSADVFGARDEVLGRAVAVKMFRFDTALGEQRGRIDAEMRLLASLHHPGLVAIYDAGVLENGETEGTPYLVMELVNGPSLSERLDSGPLGDADTARLGADLAGSLAHIHAAGIVHRDVKPANILLGAPTAAGTRHAVKLADFGIARMVDTTRLTVDGLTIGTPNYLSPEQAVGGEVGPPTDVYALGLVLIQCLTGSLAYPGVGIEAAVARLHREPEIPQQFGPGWARMLTRMTARDADERPTAAEVAMRLTDFIRGHDPAASTPTQYLDTASPNDHPPSFPVARARSRHRVAGIGVGVLGALLLLVLGVSLVTSGHGRGPAAPPAPYPSVSGQLGKDLVQLQRTVQ
jgi:serine/threonine protein kinase